MSARKHNSIVSNGCPTAHVGDGRAESGFTVVELLVVVAIIFLLSAISLFYLTAHQTLYKPDEQAVVLTDLLQEARQRSLTQREIMRVEINRDARTVTLYDENTSQNLPAPDTVTNDVVVRTIILKDEHEVLVGKIPADILYTPAETSPVDPCVFKPSSYPMSAPQSVCTIRFRPFSGETGQAAVVDAGTDLTGTNALPLSVAINVWSPSKANPSNADIARSITILAATGSIRMWEFDRDSTEANKWSNTRRGGSY